MKKPNLYKSDDLLLIIGKILAVLLFFPVLITTVYLFAENMNTPGIIADAIMFVTPVFFIITGRKIRRDEEKTLAVWNILAENPEVFIDDIENSTLMSRDEILRHLKLINMRRLGYFVYEKESGSIINGRLRRKNIIVHSCPGCGQIINENIPINLSTIPKCKYCNNPIDIKYLNKEKNRIIDEIINESREAGTVPEKRKFSIFIVIILLIFFWPVAIIYVIVKTRK